MKTGLQTTTGALTHSSFAAGLLLRKCDCGNHTVAGGQCTECKKEKSADRVDISSTSIQPKLIVGPCNDPQEQEADRIADHVASSQHSTQDPVIAGDLGQSANLSTSAPPAVAATLTSRGRHLDSSVQKEMESRFGHDFSHVRVHSDAAAEQSAKDIGAEAYTLGNNIVFGAGKFEPASQAGKRLLAHELTHVVQQSARASHNDSGIVRRACGTALGEPSPACTPSSAGMGGWSFWFKVNCDELKPGGDDNIKKLRTGSKLNIHGFASSDGTSEFNDALSCHRANRIAELVRAQRPDCPIQGIFKHGEREAAAEKKGGTSDFWRSVIVEEIKRTPEEWLDPTSVISKAWTLLARAKNNPTDVNLGNAAAHRAQLKTWLESIARSLAPVGAELERKDLDDYRRFYDSAERVWQDIDQWLAVQRHAAAATDTYSKWAPGSGTDSGPELHAKKIPQGARYHIDIFGEGFFKGAINIGMLDRTSTTGVTGTRVPNLIYRKFSGSKTNRIPIADHVADLVTSENGPLGLPGLADEIVRITAPGGTIVLFGPGNMEPYHDAIAKKAGGTVTKVKKDGNVETSITVPLPAQTPGP